MNAQIAKLENSEIKSFTVAANVTQDGATILSLSSKGNVDAENFENLKVDNVLTGSPEVTGTETTETIHAYIRGFHAFGENSDGTYNYSDLSEVFSADGMTSVGADYIYGGGIVGSDGIFGNGGELLLRLANANDAIVISETEHTVTLDINAIVYGVADTLKQIINNLTEKTTIKGFLECSAVKYYIDMFTDGITGQDVLDTVAAIIESQSGGATTADQIKTYMGILELTPAEDATVYEYLVQLVNSDTFAQAILGSEDATAFGNYKVGDLIALAIGSVGDSGNTAVATLPAQPSASDCIEILQAAINGLVGEEGMISKTRVTIPDMENGVIYTAENFKITYRFNASDVLTAVNFTGEVSYASTTANSESGTIAADVTIAVSSDVIADSEFDAIDDYTAVYYNENYELVETTVGAILAGNNGEQTVPDTDTPNTDNTQTVPDTDSEADNGAN